MKILKAILPALILGAGVAAAVLLVRTKPAPKPEPRKAVVPLVRVIEARGTNYQFTLSSQGTAAPGEEIDLVSEVPGKIVQISRAFAEGASFQQGDLLLRIDPRDFELALVRARAELARAEVSLQRELAEAEAAKREWEKLGSGKAAPLLLREPQVADARAMVEAARATVEQSARDLERTEVRAPFGGRVRSKTVDAGQYVAKGAPLGRIYGTSYVEARLPIALDELARLHLPPPSEVSGESRALPKVKLRARVGGEELFWRGQIVRTEAEINPRTRMLHAIVRVEEPYNLKRHGASYPLAAGLFVEAELLGRVLENVFVVPRSALRGEDELLVVTPDHKLQIRKVHILAKDRSKAVVSEGIRGGEMICVSPLDIVVEGMSVRVERAAGAAE